jgi:hypothetical protein
LPFDVDDLPVLTAAQAITLIGTSTWQARPAVQASASLT